MPRHTRRGGGWSNMAPDVFQRRMEQVFACIQGKELRFVSPEDLPPDLRLAVGDAYDVDGALRFLTLAFLAAVAQREGVPLNANETKVADLIEAVELLTAEYQLDRLAAEGTIAPWRPLPSGHIGLLALFLDMWAVAAKHDPTRALEQALERSRQEPVEVRIVRGSVDVVDRLRALLGSFDRSVSPDPAPPSGA